MATPSTPADGLRPGRPLSWKTGANALALLAVVALRYGNGSHGAADRLAAGMTMAAFEAATARLAPANVFDAFVEIYTWVAAAGGPVPAHAR